MRPVGVLVLAAVVCPALVLPLAGVSGGDASYDAARDDASNMAPRVARTPTRPPTAVAEAWATDWPTFRGARRDGCSPARGLLKAWPAGGPPLAWTSRELGRGYSGPAVVGQRLYTLGTAGESIVALALDAGTGRTLWSTKLGPAYENAWGHGPRGTPTVDGALVYALTPQGMLACLRTSDGGLIWQRSLEDDLGGEAPFWGYSESPLVDGDRVVVTPGGEHTLAALDKHTGATLWRSSGCDDGAQYTSIVTAEIGGRKCYLTVADRGLIGFHAEDGRLAFRDERTKNGTAHCTLPLVSGDLVYSTSGFHGGCGLVRLTRAGDTLGAQPLYASSLMKNQHGGVVLAGGHVFGYSDGAGWVCHNLLSGEMAWQDDRSLAKGSVAYADGRLYLTSEVDGTTVLLEPSSEGWREHGRLRPEGTRLDRLKGGVWTHPVIAGGKLLVRDQDLLHAYDLRAR